MKKRNLFYFLLISSLMYAQKAGDVISYKSKLDINPSEVHQFIDSNVGKEVDNATIRYLKNFNLGLKAYTIEYYTVNEKKQIVKATGLLMYPKNNHRLSTVVSTHPTTDHRNNVPSNLSGLLGIGFLVELSFALNGYIVMAPDYIGMGGGDGQHPYVDSNTEASATLDFIKAANKVIDEIGNIKRYNEYFLTGYSQGGHASMATLKKASETNEIRFKHMYTGSGPYDLSYSTLELGLLNKTIYPSSAFTASLIYSCKLTGYKVYNESPNEIIAPNYQEAFKKNILEDGGGLTWGPLVWRKLYKDSFVKDITNNPNHPLRVCLRANDNYNWRNTTPSTFGHSTEDLIVNTNSTKRAKSSQRNYYSFFDFNKYKINDFHWGPFGHTPGMIPYVIAANYKFNTLRSGGFFNTGAILSSRINKNYDSITKSIPILSIHSNIDLQLDENTILEDITSYQNDKARKSKINDLNSLQDGVYYLSIEKEGKKQIIPFVKSTPKLVDEHDIIKFEHNGIIKLNIDDVELFQINVIEDGKILKIIKTEEYQNNNGIELKNLPNGNYTFEIIANDYTIQFNKIITNSNLEVNDNLVIFSKENTINVKSRITLKEMEVYDMNSRIVYKKQQVKSRNIQTNTLSKGVYIIRVTLENNKTITKKFSL